MADVDTIEKVDTTPSDVDGHERDRQAHVVWPKKKLTDAIVFGTPVTALCGKTWVPQRDPKRYPVCPTCKDIVESNGLRMPK